MYLNSSRQFELMRFWIWRSRCELIQKLVISEPRRARKGLISRPNTFALELNTFYIVLMNEKIKSLLLSWDEYNERRYDIPYIFELEKDSQKLVSLGVKHAFDATNKQFNVIREKFSDFSALPGPKIVMIEGGAGWEPLESEIKTIEKLGEMAFVVSLAKKEGLEYMSPEPEYAEILDYLRTLFTEDDIVYQQFAIYALHYMNFTKKPDPDEFIERRLVKLRKISDKHKTVSDIKKLHRKLFHNDLDLNDSQFFYDLINPADDKGIYNEITRQESLVRDVAIIRQIVGLWNKGFSIFAVYGFSHVVNQERALRELCK